METRHWREWTQKVIGHIRFQPDRWPVEQELLAHLEDKTELLMADGVPEESACEQALVSMGDADELGVQLAAVHKPLLGYLWQWSRRIAIFAVVLLIFFGATFPLRVDFVDNSDGRFWDHVENPGEYTTVTMLSPDCKDKSDGYTFTVPYAAILYTEPHIASHGSMTEEQTELWVIVRANWWLPMVTGPWSFQDFYAVDSEGTIYNNVRHAKNQGKDFEGNSYDINPWTSHYYAWIEQFDPDAEWVELRYTRAGRDVRLRIDLTGGADA